MSLQRMFPLFVKNRNYAELTLKPNNPTTANYINGENMRTRDSHRRWVNERRRVRI